MLIDKGSKLKDIQKFQKDTLSYKIKRTSMKEKLFHKYFVIIILFIVIIASSIKLYAIFTFPHIRMWNWQMLKKIDKTKEEFSFIVLGDNKNSITSFNKMINAINKEKDVLFVIDDGDLVFDGEKEKFRFFIHQIDQLKTPILTVLGNHELREKGRANYYNLFGPFYYSFTIGKSYFIILDDANEKDIDPWQMIWLEKELEKSKKFKNLFIFMHVPLYDPRKGNYKKGHSLSDIECAKRLNALFDKYEVTMLFTSHIHGYFKGVWGKTSYIITGGAGAELFGKDPNHYFYHYIKVEVKKNGVNYKVVKFKSPKFKTINRLFYMAWIYIYAFFSIHFLDIIIVLALFYLGWYIVFIWKKWLILNIRTKR